jgi:hypothetical protein
MNIYFLAFIASFISIGLKGFQHKNVIGNHYKSVFITSYLMAVIDVYIINLIANNSLDIAFASGTGAALGMITSMYVHNRFIGKERAH